MRSKIIILGAGGFAREVYSWIKDTHEVVSFYSEDKTKEMMYNIPVISDIIQCDGQSFIAAIGNTVDRKRICDKAQRYGMILADAIIHKSATVGHDSYIGPGSIICPGAIITNDVYLGKSTIVNLGATIGHDTKISDFVTISPGANISGNVTIGDRSYIGTNSAIREKITIGSLSVIGMGAAVITDVPDKECWVGVPAKKM